MKLTELGASFFGDSSGRSGLGLIFECPTCVAKGIPTSARACLPVHFKNPLDGGPPADVTFKMLDGTVRSHPLWERTGDTLEALTLHPSVDASHHDHDGHKGWHGWIRNGEVDHA